MSVHQHLSYISDLPEMCYPSVECMQHLNDVD